ncbi:MAG: ABC transporter substrate-binding protein [Candidatus Doudnabacteria bacterium]|nr:ABC transporter substrate-binding protein [Candidatus Doudnabacteria bacterium]
MNKKISLYIVVLIVAGLFSVLYINHTKNQKFTDQFPTVRVGLNPWIGNGLYYYAQDKGIYKQNGINVNLVEYDDNSVGKQLLNSNQIDVLPFTPDVLVDLKAAGADVTAVAITDNSQGADGIVASDKIKTIADLKGQTVAFETGSTSQLLLAQILAKAGLTLNDIKPLSMSAGDAGAAFLAGKVDVAVTWEPWLTKDSTRPGGHILASSKDLDVLPDIMIFRTDFVTKHPDVVSRFMASFFDAVTVSKQNPQEIQAELANQYGLSPSEVQQMMPKFSWFDLAGNMEKFAGNGSPTKNLTESANQIWTTQGIISQQVNLQEVWDDSFLNTLNHANN